MNQKYIKIIIVVLIVFGLYFTVTSIHNSYQFQLTNQNELPIAIIGALISTVWFFPFFIIAYFVYRKYKKSTNPTEMR
ncbi:hypothetical protein [Nitrosopumilus sp. Nsub]|uniref:hypothetical protein n=1 Tax=Nitrosopumilus sp. Nsub TaxID=1776294 RepID=UPI00082AB0B1|nr:hypothetical protein [Nitrosopumilus sp. Nsub]